jgi:hypothetical protein
MFRLELPRPWAAPALFVLAAIALVPSAAVAKIPSWQNSDVPARMLVAPDGSVEFHVVFRDIANVPIAGSVVFVDLSRCTGLRIVGCSECAGATPYDPETRIFETQTAADGSATIRVCGSIVCDESAAEKPVWVMGDGAVVRWVTVATTDLSGNGLVDEADVALWDVRAAAGDRIGDYDGDGDLDVADRAFLSASIGAHCDAAVPTQAASWGRLKAIHR